MNLKIGVFVAALLGVAESAYAADLPNTKPAAPPQPPTLASCASPSDFVMTACPLTYYGVTVYGMVDFGVGYQDHALPFNRAEAFDRFYVRCADSRHGDHARTHGFAVHQHRARPALCETATEFRST